ncbi:MAG: alpha-N-arabinofuranosidase [Chloroflexi bacterium]|nr:alpha-N-arabinofuranosidase [Chloroflexota bacterium]
MARIKIDRDRRIGTIDRHIYGGFVEHLGRCIYGGIYEEGSPLSDGRGFRTDVLEGARALRMPNLRWPGGNFVSGYHWLDGVGPLDQRPRKVDLAWGAEESNRFGTDEFLAYARELRTEPYICVNAGTGSIDEAQAWVEYCNGATDTHWANLRRKNGHAEPYNVKFWGLGNELWGPWQLGQMTAEDYVKKAREFAKVMRLTDPSIKLVACGKDGLSDWDREVVDGLARYVDYHSIHIYTGSADYYSNVFAPKQAERALTITQGMIDKARYDQKLTHPIHVAYDEWNVWYRARGPVHRKTGIEEQYDLADALAIASYLNVFIRQCKTVKLANFAQLVNAIGAMFTNQQAMFLQTVYHPLRLYGEHMRDLALDPFVDCPQYDLRPEAETSPREHRVADLGPFPLLDVAATLDEDGRTLVVGVVNRDRDHAISASIELQDGGKLAGGVAYEVNGDAPEVLNTFERPDAVTVRERSLDAAACQTYTFPAHSATVLKLTVA